MRVAMPLGQYHGWGVAGKYLAAEISKLPELPGVTLHCISGVEMKPLLPEFWDSCNIGYCFFEREIEVLQHTRRAAREWDFVVAGSSWCEQNLRIGGIRQTATILQGVDPAIFYPAPEPHNEERFVVFSGGKFEYRKSQDLVIAAMKLFMERHADVYLACSWYNQWPAAIDTMALSSHIVFDRRGDDSLTFIRHVLADNGIPLERAIIYPLVSNSLMRDIYLSTDIGLFPNRCEGGNNMVMCEYMACGRTVVASDMTGHGDVIHERNAFPLTSYKPKVVSLLDEPSGVWFEPSVAEIVSFLEQAYHDRQAVRRKERQAALDMSKLSWAAAARQFHQIGLKLLGRE